MVNLLSKKVKHKGTLGIGTIIEQDEKYITVQFISRISKFQYPIVFEQFLTLEDLNDASAVKAEIAELKLIKEGEKIAKVKEKELEVEDVIKKRRIKYLTHFTRLENLHSILQNGLIPVSLHKDMEVESIHNDSYRIDKMPHCTSCSVQFPNYKLFYSFRERENFHSQWVVIILDINLLLSSKNTAYYCYSNAAGIYNKEKMFRSIDFENMFSDSIMTKENKLIRRKYLEIDDNYTTDPQAEILISNTINPSYIKYIYFQEKNDIFEYIKKYGLEVLSKYKYKADTFFFSPRKDYMYW